MTNYIEEMMKTAGVEKTCNSECKRKIQKYCNENKTCRDTYFEPFPLCVGFDNCNKEYKEKEENYPHFTAAKQLEIIKLIFKKCFIDIQDNKINFSYYDSPITYELHSNNFAQNLAALVINIWKNLAKEDKQKVKEVLER